MNFFKKRKYRIMEIDPSKNQQKEKLLYQTKIQNWMSQEILNVNNQPNQGIQENINLKNDGKLHY